jgi:hypothetical protein
MPDPLETIASLAGASATLRFGTPRPADAAGRIGDGWFPRTVTPDGFPRRVHGPHARAALRRRGQRAAGRGAGRARAGCTADSVGVGVGVVWFR